MASTTMMAPPEAPPAASPTTAKEVAAAPSVPGSGCERGPTSRGDALSRLVATVAAQLGATRTAEVTPIEGVEDVEVVTSGVLGALLVKADLLLDLTALTVAPTLGDAADPRLAAAVAEVVAERAKAQKERLARQVGASHGPWAKGTGYGIDEEGLWGDERTDTVSIVPDAHRQRVSEVYAAVAATLAHVQTVYVAVQANTSVASTLATVLADSCLPTMLLHFLGATDAEIAAHPDIHAQAYATLALLAPAGGALANALLTPASRKAATEQLTAVVEAHVESAELVTDAQAAHVESAELVTDAQAAHDAAAAAAEAAAAEAATTAAAAEAAEAAEAATTAVAAAAATTAVAPEAATTAAADAATGEATAAEAATGDAATTEVTAEAAALVTAAAALEQAKASQSVLAALAESLRVVVRAAEVDDETAAASVEDAAADGEEGGKAEEVAAFELRPEGKYEETLDKYRMNLKAKIVDLGQHHYKSNWEADKGKVDKTRMKRVKRELRAMRRALPVHFGSSILVRVDKARPYVMEALIFAPEGTPYDSGAFLFDIYCPPGYPSTTPKVNLRTTGGGSVRFNPNLYDTGKVCLSLLGTWSGETGENWGPDSTIMQVLISIQALIFVDLPYFNEPGYEHEIGTSTGAQHARTATNGGYERLRVGTVQWAMVDMLQNPPAGFEAAIAAHFRLKRAHIEQVMRDWVHDTTKHDANEQHTLLKKQVTAVLALFESKFGPSPLPPVQEAASTEEVDAAAAEDAAATPVTDAEDAAATPVTDAEDAAATPVTDAAAAGAGAGVGAGAGASVSAPASKHDCTPQIPAADCMPPAVELQRAVSG